MTGSARNQRCPCGSGRKYKNCCWARDQAAAAEAAAAEDPDRAPERARKAAGVHPWDAGIFPLRIQFEDEPEVRVSVALVTAGQEILMGERMAHPLGRLEDVVDALEAVIEHVERDTDVAPRTVRVRHADVATALAVRLAGRGVEVEFVRSLPGLEAAARLMADDMTGSDHVPVIGTAPTWNAWGLSPARSRALFAAAGRFWRAAPWERLADAPIGVWSRQRFWAASVQGAESDAVGLLVYTDDRDAWAFPGDVLTDMDAVAELHGGVVSLIFAGRDDLTREMQREVASAGWEVADPEGYPMLLTIDTPAGGLDPAVVDMITALLIAVPDFVDDQDEALNDGLAGETIEWSHPATRISLRYDLPGGFEWPVPARLQPGGPEGEGAEPGVLLPTVLAAGDPLPDQGLLDAFEAALREELAESTVEKHARNAAELVVSLNGQGIPVRALHEHDLRTFLYDDFPRGRPGYGRTDSMPTSLRRFFEFLDHRHALRFPWAAPILADRNTFNRRVATAPEGAWWDGEVQDFRADVHIDLDRRVMLLPDEWGGALEGRAFTGIGEARLRQEAQRAWLTWRDDLVRDGIETPDALRDALMERLLDWLDAPAPHDPQGRTRLELIRAERNAGGPGQEEELRRVFFGEEAE